MPNDTEPLTWDEVDDAPLKWDEVNDAPTRNQPNMFEMAGIPRSQPQPTFTQLYDKESAAQLPSPSGIESTLTGGDLPMTPEGEAQATVAMPTTEQFRGHYKLVGETPKKTSGDITEELEDLRGSENVTREDVAAIPFNAALRIGQQGAGHILQGLALATPPGMESGVRDVENQSASKRLENVLTSDMAVKGKALVETALKTHPNIDPNSLGTKVGEAIGGFLPAVLTGPFAPILFGLQSAGATLEATYEDLISQGVDKEEAARIATRKAIASGVFQGVLLKYLPHQLRKVGDKFINKIVGDVVRKELIPKAGRFALGRAAQAVEGGIFGGASLAGENVIHNRDITEGMEEGVGGMAAINAFMRRGATPQEAKWSQGEKIRRITENVRIEGSRKRIKAREDLIKRDGPITDQDLEEFGGLKAAKDEGRLRNPKLLQRLNELELKMSSDSPLEAEYQSHLDQGLSAKNKNAVYREIGDKEVARIDDDGNVVIDRFELAHALNDLPTVKERKDLIDRIVEEESVHLATTRKQALDFFMRSTKAEQDINEELYFGKNSDARDVNYADDVSTENHRTLMGYEMIRRAVQRAAKSSATETAYKIGFDRDAKRVLSAMEGMIFSMRSRLNRMKNAEGGPVVAQELILKDVTAKMAEARKIIEAKQAEKKAAPSKAEAPVAEAPKGKELVEGVDPDNIPFSINPSSRNPRSEREQKDRMEFAKQVARATGDQMMEMGKGGFNKHNIELGLYADADQLRQLKEMSKEVDAEYQTALKKVNEGGATQEEIMDFTRIAMKPQFFNEAIKMAEMINGNKNVEYRGKVPEGMMFEFVGDHKQGDSGFGFIVKETATAEDILARITAMEGTFKSGKKWKSPIAATEDFAERHERLMSENRDSQQLDPKAVNKYGNLDHGDFGPQSFPSTRRPGESKKDELRRMAEEIRLRKLEAKGVELTPEEKKRSEGSLVAKDVTTLAPVEKSERVGAVESGALPRLKNTAMYEQADKEVAAKRPDFDNFSEWVQNNMGQAEPEQLRDLWEDAVNKLEDAPGARFEELRSALRLTGKYGTRRIPDLNERFVLESPQGTMPKDAPVIGKEGRLAWRERQVEAPVVDLLSRQHARQKVEADQRYRNKVWGAIRLKLIHESLTERADFNRDKISLDDIDFGNEKTDHGAYTEINAQDIRNRENLLEILNDEARGSSVDARSLTRRLVAVVDKAGRVHLVGTYREGGKQRVVDPAGVANRLKPTRELNQSFLKQYRPFASILLTDPIRGFKQQFATVTEFNQKIGTEALERSRVGDNPFIGEGEPQHPFFAEGTEGIEGEGGSFRGPFKNLVDAKTSRGAQDVGGPVNRIEAQQIVDHLLRKYGEITSEGDVQDAIESLEIRARHKKLTAKDHVAINAYRKLADHIQKADPKASQGQVLSRMIKKLWEVIDMWGENPDPSRVLDAFYGKPESEPVRKSERNQVDLTKRGDIRNPMDQRLFAGPFQRAEVPPSILGKEQPAPEMYGPEVPESYVQQRVREFKEKTEPWRGRVEPPESMKVAGEEPAFRRRRDDLDRMSDEEFTAEVNKAKERIKQRAEDIRPRGETPESLEQYRRTSKMPATPFDMARAKKVRDRIYKNTGELISYGEANRIASELGSVKEANKKRSDEGRARRQVEQAKGMERQQEKRDRRIADLVDRRANGTMSYRESMESLSMPKSRRSGEEYSDRGPEREEPDSNWWGWIGSPKTHDDVHRMFESSFKMVEKNLNKDEAFSMGEDLASWLLGIKGQIKEKLEAELEKSDKWTPDQAEKNVELVKLGDRVDEHFERLAKWMNRESGEDSFPASRFPDSDYYHKFREDPKMSKEVEDVFLGWWKNREAAWRKEGKTEKAAKKWERESPGTMAGFYEESKNQANKQKLTDDLSDAILNMAAIPSSEWGLNNKKRALALKWYGENKNLAYSRELLTRGVLSAHDIIVDDIQLGIAARQAYLDRFEGGLKLTAKRLSEGEEWNPNSEAQMIRDGISQAKNEIEYYRNLLRKENNSFAKMQKHLKMLEAGGDGNNVVTHLLKASANVKSFKQNLLDQAMNPESQEGGSGRSESSDGQGEFPLSRVPGGFEKSTKEQLDRFRKWAASPTVTNPEELMVDLQSPIPRFAENINSALTRALGFERVPILGKMFGPRARIRDEVDKSVIGYAVKRSIGNSQSALIGARMNALKDSLGEPFAQNKEGEITNVKANPEQSRFISDLFEDWQRQIMVPEHMKSMKNIDYHGIEHRIFSDKEIAKYVANNPVGIELTPEQDKFFRAMHDVLRDGYEYLKEKRVQMEELKGDAHTQKILMGFSEGTEVYPFPRVALHKRSVGPAKGEWQRRIGGSYRVENERQYKTEAEGQKTVAYEPDMVKRLAAFVQRVYKAVADADLANDPVLEGTTPEQRQLSLAKEYEADLRSGRMTQKDIIDLSYDARLSTEGTVLNHPAFSGKVYPIAIANKLNKAFGADKHRYVNAAAELSTISKTLMLTGDLAQYLQQGAPMMISHPKAWGRAVSASLKSLVDPNVSGRYFSNKENYEAATEFAQIGGSIGHLQDFMSGSGSGEFVNRIPGVRQLVTRSGRAFGTFFDISKIEMWKALRKNTPKEQAAEVVEMIDNIVLSGKMEAMGMAHGRAIAERLLLMAPSYYRGALQLVAGAGQKGVAGNEARKVLGTYATGMVAGMTGLYLAAGMSWEEIRNRLTPGADNDKFLSYPIKVGDRTMEIGPGGIVMQLISLMADMGDAMVNDPKKLIPWGPDNPMMKFLSSKLGPVPGFAKEWYTGKDSQGRLSSGPVEAASKLAMPIAAQTTVQKLVGIGKGNKSNLAMDATRSAVGFIGLKARTPSKANEMHVLANEFLKSKNLKKETGWEMTQTNEPSYSRLRSAALSGSESAFRQAYEGLLETHTKAEIQAGMEKWYRRGFTGTVTHENRFYASLTPEQKKTYKEAKKEKLMIWKAYREMRRKM